MMKLKYIVFLLSGFLTFYAEGAELGQNLCDDLKARATSPSDYKDFKDCLEDKKYGPSAYYLAQQEKEIAETEKQAADEAKKAAEAAKKAADEAKNKSNLEEKTFTSDELRKFGQPFLAESLDYNTSRSPDPKRITTGDALCAFYEYEKVKKSRVSEVLFGAINGKGLVIDTILGFNKAPELFQQKNQRIGVRKYVELTCVRRINKSLEGSDIALKEIIEDFKTINQGIERNANTGMENKARKSGRKESHPETPRAYNPEDWTGSNGISQ